MAFKYSEKTKREVVDFVRKYNQLNKRGGKSAARKKFGINPITITKWCDSEPVPDSDKRIDVMRIALQSISNNEALNGHQCREIAANALFDFRFE